MPRIPTARRPAATRRRSPSSPATISSRSSSAGCGPTTPRCSSFPTGRWAEVQPLIEARFGNWTRAAVAKGVKSFTAPPPRPTAPQDPAGQPSRRAAVEHRRRPAAAARSAAATSSRSMPPTTCSAATSCRGSTWTCAKSKGWSYGVSGDERLLDHAVPYVVSAPVQADKTGDSLAELNRQISEFLTDQGRDRGGAGSGSTKNINQLPGEFETSGAVLGAMMSMDMLGRPDNYYETLAPRISRADRGHARPGGARPRSIPRGSHGSSSAMRPRCGRSWRSSECRSRWWKRPRRTISRRHG